MIFEMLCVNRRLSVYCVHNGVPLYHAIATSSNIFGVLPQRHLVGAYYEIFYG